MKKLLLISFILISANTFADMLPKPEMIFSFKTHTKKDLQIDFTQSEQIQCEDNQCITKKPLGDYGFQKLHCKSTDNCFSLSYKYSPYQKLIITTKNGKKLESNIFLKSKKLRSEYLVHVYRNKIFVEEAHKIGYPKSIFRIDFVSAFLITIILEFLAVLIIIFPNKPKVSILLSATLVNFISVPLIWFFYPIVNIQKWVYILFIWAFEAAFIYAWNKDILSMKQCGYYSFITNTVSLTVGMIISFIFSSFLIL